MYVYNKLSMYVYNKLSLYAYNKLSMYVYNKLSMYVYSKLSMYVYNKHSSSKKNETCLRFDETFTSCKVHEHHFKRVIMVRSVTEM